MNSLVPDYFNNFRCKAGRCRTACCDGWPVTFSMADYFKLLSLQCSPELKDRLDRALHLTDHPTQEEYGMLLADYEGRCRMHRADGLCALQAEAGENALPAVCRQYPRSIRFGECCCTNSCEAVIELLDRVEPIQFLYETRPETVPDRPREHFFETGGRETEIRLWLIGLMQDRTRRIPERLLRLGAAVRRMDEALTEHDADAVDSLLSGSEQLTVPVFSADRSEALQVVYQLMERMDELSDSVREYGEAALKRFDRDGRISDEDILHRLEAVDPHWEEWFENVIVNHMFFAQFPFQDRPVSLKNEVIALYCVYALMRFLVIGAGDGTKERMTDIIAALFRLVDHTAFDRYAIPIIQRICGEDRAWMLLRI